MLLRIATVLVRLAFKGWSLAKLLVRAVFVIGKLMVKNPDKVVELAILFRKFIEWLRSFKRPQPEAEFAVA